MNDRGTSDYICADPVPPATDADIEAVAEAIELVDAPGEGP